MMDRQRKDDETQTTKPPRSKLRRAWALIALVAVVGVLILGEVAFQWGKRAGWTTYTSAQVWAEAWGVVRILGMAVMLLLLAVWNVRLVLRRPVLRAEATPAQGADDVERRRVELDGAHLAVIAGGFLGLAATLVSTKALGGLLAEMLGFFWTGGHSYYGSWRSPTEAAIQWGAWIGGLGVLAGGLVWLELRRKSAAEGLAMPGCLAVPGLVVSCLGLVCLADYILARHIIIIAQGQGRPPMGFPQVVIYISSVMGGACAGVGVLTASRFARAKS